MLFVADPSFELGLPDWSFSGQAVRENVGAAAFDGAFVARLESREGGIVLPDLTSTIAQSLGVFPALPGQPLSFRYQRVVQRSGQRLRISFNAGGGLFEVGEVMASGAVGVWEEWTGSFDLSPGEPGLVQITALPTGGAAIGTARWYVDLVSLGTEDPDVTRRQTIRAGIIATCEAYGSWTVPIPKFNIGSVAVHETDGDASWVNVLLLEEQTQIREGGGSTAPVGPITRRRPTATFGMHVHAVDDTTCDEIAGCIQRALDAKTPGQPWLGLPYVQLVTVTRVKPREEPSGSGGSVRELLAVVSVEFTVARGDA